MYAIYARQSIERQDSVSIEAQVEQCRRFTDGEVTTYADAGYSGKNTNRPEFEHMMQDIKSGKITAVVSYRLDRVSRNITDFAGLLGIFEKQGVKYISATEQFDTSTPMGRAMIYIVMVFAQLERETIATRISDNYRFRANKGLFMGGNTPFGYASRKDTIDGKAVSVLEPNEQKDILMRIFESFSSKESLYSIGHNLNTAGLLTAKGNTWSTGAIKRVLQNITPCCADEHLYHYLTACGYSISNSIEDFDGTHGMCIFFKNKNRNQLTEISEQVAVIGLHKPLISSEQYIHAQKILNTNPPSHGKRASRTFLAGLVKCKECGHSFGVKYTARGATEYAYYRCRGREQRGVCENSAFLKAHDIEAYIIQECKIYLDNISVKESQTEKPEVYKPYSEVEQLQAQIQNLIDNIGKGNSVVDNLLTQKITALQIQIDEITKNIRSQPTPIIDAKFIKTTRENLNRFSEFDMNQKTDIIRGIVKSITIDKNHEVQIEFFF